MFWIGLAVGVVVGLIVGGALMALLASSKYSNWAIDYAEKIKKQNKK